MKIKTSLLIPLSLFVLAFFLRLLLIGRGPFHVDCLNLIIQAQESIETQRLQFLYGSGYPLMVILGVIFIKLADFFSITNSIFAINLIGALTGALCIPLFYSVTEKMTDKPTALLAAVFLCFCPIFLGVSVVGLNHAPSLLFLLLSINFLLKDNGKLKSKNLIYGSIFLGFMGATRLQDMILVGPAICFLIYISSDKTSFKNFILNLIKFWCTTFVIIFLFHIPYLFGEGQGSYFNQFGTFWDAGLTGNYRGVTLVTIKKCISYMSLNLTTFGFIISLIGFFWLLKNNLRLSIFLILWVSITLLFYANINTTVPRYILISLLPMIITLSYFLIQTSKLHIVAKEIVVVVFFVLLYFNFSYIYPILEYRSKHARLAEYAKFVESRTEENSIILSSDERIFIHYFGNRHASGRPFGLKHINPEELIQFKSKIDNWLKNDTPVYLTFPGMFVSDPQNQFSDMIWNNYYVNVVGHHYYEDWHRGPIRQNILYLPLFKIEPKDNE